MPSTSKSSLGLPAGAGGVGKVQTRRGSASNPPSKQENDVGEDEYQVENFGPPRWRTVLNKRADLGFPDFYPSRPGFGQPEDVLTEENVKNGYSARPFSTVTSAESFSMHGPIHNQLVNGGCLNTLNKLGQEIIDKRDEAMPQFGDRTFRIPVRVTYNDVKRSQFLSDLANPAVPLAKLMRNPIPHGFKGLELLDTMFSPTLNTGPSHNRTASGTSVPTSKPPSPIAVDRALWFIRVLGCNEISAHRGRAQPAITTSAPSPAAAATPASSLSQGAAPTLPLSSNDWHTQEFTNLFTSWLRIQLNQLALPGVSTVTKVTVPPRAGSGVLNDESARNRWLTKWEYSCSLLKAMLDQSLLSSRLLSGWLTDMFSDSNLAQLGFVAKLMGEYIAGIARYLYIARPCLRALCVRIREIRGSPASGLMTKTETLLRTFVKSLCDANVLVLLDPTLWREYRDLLFEIVGPEHPSSIMEERSKVLMFRAPSTVNLSTPRRQQMEDLQRLDSINAETKMLALSRIYFDEPSGSNPFNVARFESKVNILLNWAMGSFQLGIHRAYSVYTLLTLWRDQFDEQQSKAARPAHIDFFPVLYRWLDESEAATSEANIQAIGITFGELTRQGLFSYGRYLQALIAHGHSARSSRSTSHHLRILRALPIFVQTKDLLHQRRIALTGDDDQLLKKYEAEEEDIMTSFRQEIMEFVPEIFGYKRYGNSANYKEAVNHQLPSTSRITRHLFLQARFWLYPLAVSSLVVQGRRPALTASAFARILHSFRLCDGFSTIADYLVKTLQISQDPEILDVVIDTVRRDAECWTAMDRWDPLVDALMERHTSQDAQGRHHLPLTVLLVELSEKGRLNAGYRAEIEQSVAMHRNSAASPSSSFWDGKESMEGLQKSIATGDYQGSLVLAPRMFSRHGPFDNWSTLWWQTIVTAITTSNTANSSSIIAASIAHISAVSTQSGGQLNGVVDTWLDTVTDAVDLLSQSASVSFCSLLLHACARRLLRLVSKLLEKLVYPVWSKMARATLASKMLPGDIVALENSLLLAQQLLLTEPPEKSLPPTNLREALVLQTARSDALTGPRVTTMIQHLPFLVVLKSSPAVSDAAKRQISQLLAQLAVTPQFKAAAFRHLEVLKDAFLSNEWNQSSLENLEAGMVDALKMIMSQGQGDEVLGLDSADGSSAWRWTSVVLSMRVEFKRLAMRIERDNPPTEARDCLSRLVHSSLDRDISADDADLLCESLRGIERIVAQEVMLVGMDRLKGLLSKVVGADTQSQIDSPCKSIDLLLRVLDAAARASSIPWTDTGTLTARHGLLDLISVALQSLERHFSVDAEVELPDGADPPKASEILHLCFRLLRFSLGLPVREPVSLAAHRVDFGRLAASFTKVVLSLPVGIGARATTRLSDMLTYILDSAPATTRHSAYSAVLAELAASSLNGARKSTILESISPMSPRQRPVALATTQADAEEISLPLDDRSWEMFEQLQLSPKRARGQDLYLASQSFKDTAAMPMSFFDPRIQYDSIPIDEPLEDSNDDDSASELSTHLDMYASERDLGNSLAGHPDMWKQLSTALYAGPDEASVEDEIVIHHGASPHESVASPASLSTVSNTTRPRGSSSRLLPQTGQGSGSNKDPITLDEDDDEEEEEEPEVVETRPGKRPRLAGKTTGGKTTAGKTTAGKSTRKVTGGKSLGRKAVSGKGRVGGKAPSKGRKKSVQE